MSIWTVSKVWNRVKDQHSKSQFQWQFPVSSEKKWLKWYILPWNTEINLFFRHFWSNPPTFEVWPPKKCFTAIGTAKNFHRQVVTEFGQIWVIWRWNPPSGIPGRCRPGIAWLQTIAKVIVGIQPVGPYFSNKKKYIYYETIKLKNRGLLIH